MIWLGYGIGPKLAVIALICFFPITVNTFDGLRSVDPDAVRMMRTLDAARWAILRRVELPAALPFFFSGAKIAVAVAAIGAVFGEWVGADEGLGHLMLTAQSQSADGPGVRRDRRCSRSSRSRSSGCWRCSSGASPGGTREGLQA